MLANIKCQKISIESWWVWEMNRTGIKVPSFNEAVTKVRCVS